MNIEIRQPRLEELLRQRMASGQFEDVEDAILQALESAPTPPDTDSSHLAESESSVHPSGFGRSLVGVFSRAQGFAGDLDLSRDPSTGRTIDLS